MLLIDLYDTYKAHNRRLRSTKTDLVYRIAIRQLSDALGKTPTIADLSDESLIALERYLDDGSRSPYTINERTGRIKAVWRWAAKRGIVSHWPTSERLPVHEPYKRAWTIEQVHQLLQACEKMPGRYASVKASAWWRYWHLVQWETGERTGAMLELRWEWLDTRRRGLDVPGRYRKGNKQAFHPLSSRLLKSLGEFRRPTRDLLFPWEMTASTLYHHYGRLLQWAGLPNGRKNKPHKMRRTHLTYWAAGGGDATKRAGHSSAAITERYYLDDSLIDPEDPDTRLPKIG